jgi:hypothetical protein
MIIKGNMNVLRNINTWPSNEEDVLDFYDHPTIFVSRDPESTYLVYWASRTAPICIDWYMVTDITEDELSSIKTNKITIRDFFLGDPNKPIYMFTDGRTGTDQKSYLAKHEDIENYVPEQGVYLNRED